MIPYLNNQSINRTVLDTVLDITEYYSYNTLVAFRFKGKIYCRKNDWSVTTGKFLNQIEPDKSRRFTKEEFHDLYRYTIIYSCKRYIELHKNPTLNNKKFQVQNKLSLI